jgi:hypothetical protein
LIIDQIDYSIIKIFYNLKPNESTNTYEITLKIFSKKLVNYKYTIIKNRLKKLASYGLFKISGDKFKVYELLMENVNFCTRKYKDGIEEVVDLKIEDEWCSFTLKSFQ